MIAFAIVKTKDLLADFAGEHDGQCPRDGKRNERYERLAHVTLASSARRGTTRRSS